MSIRLRLTLWYSGILSVTLLLFGFGLYLFLSFYIYNDLEKQLGRTWTETYERIKPLAAPSIRGRVPIKLELDNVDMFSENTLLQLASLNDTEGPVIHDRSSVLKNLELTLPITNNAAQKLRGKDSLVVERLNLKVMDKSYPIILVSRGFDITDPVTGNKLTRGVLQVGATINYYENFFNLLQYTLAILAMLTVLIAGTLGWFLARKALRPIEQVIVATQQIEKGTDLDKRILYDGPEDEIGRLTVTINGMLGRLQLVYSELEEAYRAQRRFVSDASHELRTPLTTIRGNVELLEKMWSRTLTSGQAGGQDKEQMEMSIEAMQDIAGEAHRMSRLVNDMLSLARADAGFEMQRQPLELRPLVEEVARRAQFLPRQVQWEVGDLEPLTDVVVVGNKDYVQQLLFIFIENAFKYTEEGSVRLDALRSGDQVGLRIADTGIGMDKEEVPHIFDRFYRADVSRGRTAGTGLGLSIAKWIIDEHKGSIEVKTRQGEGSTFIIWLPVVFLPVS
ncbi:sensor histidine kinase [Paenibacillus chitinolyticus]|uniref:histidine kinase n=1 Tax=Paenibacillus chitinolyticus TaxID=79263 RepID=A0A410WSV5_9BACL|nr:MULTISPECIES: HAMP domain-containing sensor histidine kinase [Paenibacillus]MCY9588784.1 HAMP domain-containing histidine kinase [Paenibacillus chitinolyticus]MCY9595712.1 HAMP domain-containing histidine kinase [Paenibacillus chitinolyticus]QAV17468.1 sensor histidine kinase [Paenibacillus chitinolyticus]GKS09617.1 two-component sensor histidine kinase [Paenibacillus chitinolyticus]